MGRVKVDIGINALVDELSALESKSLMVMDDVIDNGDVNKKWQPKKWKIEYEKVVMYDLMGLKGYEIAEKMGLTPQHVYNILGCDEAIAIQKALIGRVRKEALDMTQELSEIQELTVLRLKNCLKDDATFAESRLGFISKGIDVMKGVGDYLKQAPTNQQVNNFTLPPSIAESFLTGLEKSDRARELMLSNKGREVAVVESND